ncbi:TonB-dependent receptor domain-containing protein [Sandarakinorhabdus sp. DWP1-3-1]|uniref:TonB-dependent receptor domain-containing protein n=1 Tax=Sandarakinorhabdus sp. DWP1-3-1 TaxID=2804627 RepID=UPI003CEEDE51
MRTIILSSASALALLAAAASAQTVAPAAPPATTTAAAEAADEGLVIVTGSRIARAGLDSAVPVTTLTRAELTINGEVNIGDQLSQLPAFRVTSGSQNSGGAIGTAGLNILDLRGQGTARTLVLQNGRRHVTSQPGTSTVDTSTIPNALVERVDIVTGANSAVYGSDAIAGVVNFITKKDFDGIALDGQTGLSSRGDRPTYFLSGTYGKNFNDGRGNIAVNVEYSQQNPLYYSQREDFAGALGGRSQFQLTQDTSVTGPGRTPEPAAGDGIFDTTFIRNVNNIGITTGGAITSACPAPTPTNAARVALNCSGLFTSTGAQLGNVFAFLPDGTLVKNVVTTDFRPFGSGNAVGGLGSTLREVGQLSTGTTRYAGNILARYEFDPAFTVFAEAKYVMTQSQQEGQPTFSSGALNPTFSINNPFLTAQARSTLVTLLAPGATGFALQRFNIDFAGRGEDHSRDLYRIVLGVEGTFNDTWRYEVAANYGHVDTYYETRGNVNLAKFTNSVNAVRNTAGNIVCGINNDAIATNDDAACVPVNLFGLGAPSAEALNYFLYTSSRKQRSDQLDFTAFVSGDTEKWFSLPGGPVAFSVGGEYRRETSFSAFDAFTRGGGTFLNSIADFAPPPLEVKEAYGELRLPLVKDVFLLRELTLEGAARISDYNTGNTGSTFAWNAGVTWSPVQDLRFRAGYGRAVRAPTQFNLFASQSQTFLNGLVDPCGQQNINSNPNRAANCAAGGVPTTQTFNGITEPFTNRPASGISGLNGGNPLLDEEVSNSYTIGGVFTPRFAPGLVLTVDYYNIELKNAINTVLAQTVINQCYDSPDGIDNSFCRALTRNPNGTFAGQQNVLHAGSQVDFPATGSSFTQGPFNYARQKTSGIDFDLTYNTTFGADWRFGTRAIVSYLIERNEFTSITEPGRITQEKQTLGDPEWQGQLRLNLGYKAFDASVNIRYIGKMTVAAGFDAQNSVQGRPPTNADQFPRVFYPNAAYADFRFQYELTPGKRIYVGVDNAFDKLPPFDLLGLTDSAIYSNTGRFFYGGFSVRY